MSKSHNQKLKLLYLQQILSQQTDEDHTLTANELIHALEQYEIKAERKSIYTDLALLQQSGMDIQRRRGRLAGWFLGERTFQMAELKLLVDVVQSCRFLTEKKSESLIHKLEGFSSKYQASQLRRQVFVDGRTKTMNESIYYNIDKLHIAISGKQAITFHYFDYNVEKEKALRRDGKRYIVSPFGLIWNNDNYYLVAFDSQMGEIRHYRVDKMTAISVTNLPLQGETQYAQFNLATYSERHFSMYSGEDCTVTLRCRNHMSGVIIVRFGRECNLIPDGTDYFIVRLPVVLSPPFFGWLFGLEEEVFLIAPQNAVDIYTHKLTSLTAKYQQV